jgi:hypothetical protein
VQLLYFNNFALLRPLLLGNYLFRMHRFVAFPLQIFPPRARFLEISS